jgi:hypothetical protein
VYKYKTNIAIEGTRKQEEGFANPTDQCIDEDNTVRKLTEDEKKEADKKADDKADKKEDKKEDKKADKKADKKEDKKADKKADKKEDKKEDKKKSDKEVFLIYNKVNYLQAKELCKVYSGRLATKDDLEEAFKDGANWCTWGWLDGEKIGYPVQETFWSFIEKKHKGHCGPTAGINIIDNIDPLKVYSVTCYGKKPKKSKNDIDLELVLNEVSVDDSLQAEIEKCKRSKEEAQQKKWIDEEKKNIRIVTFNESKWSTTTETKKK